MPSMKQSRAATNFEIDEVRHRVNLTRHLVASVEQAFTFWTDPRHVKQWWDAAGEDLLECEIDPSVGGSLRFVSSRSGTPPFVGKYLEIDPPHRLVFEAMGAIGTVSIQESGSGSRIDVEIRAPNAEALKAMLAVGVAAGTAQTLDNLQAHAAKDLHIL
jgi:uncharacterized protein YndB with AHSA1/START domain